MRVENGRALAQDAQPSQPRQWSRERSPVREVLDVNPPDDLAEFASSASKLAFSQIERGQERGWVMNVYQFPQAKSTVTEENKQENKSADTLTS